MTPEELSRFSLLSDLTQSQLEEVAEFTRPVSFAARQLILEEGRAADRCWLIRSGHVSLETRHPNGRSSVVQTLAVGDVLGWSCLLPPFEWRYDVVTEDAVTAFEIDAVRLRAAVEQDCSLGYPILHRLVEVLVDRLHSAHARLVDVYGNPRAH
jgi:CRP/FNR family cyclic AMP-dependent transcriptional regulator